ncbi:MAG: hypothetical protein B6I30_07950 [Desulfobacteraceae bacterium 4572_187]|nr:MAG: hypothetical protein B6I30_07950 [Desulfobacteraceae bacterium 4572_187]
MTKFRELIEQILNIEWEMFRRVRSAAPANCQQAPEAFRKIRGSIFQTWTEEILEPYLDDLRAAKKMGRNLPEEKYARMDNLIPPLNVHPLIEKIVAIEAAWQDELKKKYPAIYNRMCRSTDPAGNGSNFSVYLRCELETYGNNTLKAYHEHVRNASEKGENLSLTALELLLQKGGYRDLLHAENCLSGTLQ